MFLEEEEFNHLGNVKLRPNDPDALLTGQVEK
jgi:hypothetical protein